MADNEEEMRSLALTPTWSVASVLTIFVVVSLLVERSIHRLSTWLRKTNRKPLLEAVEKMKEELMLLGFISLLLTATSSLISNICIPSRFYNTPFTPCTKAEIDEQKEDSSSEERKLYTVSVLPHLFRRMLNGNEKTCKEGYEPFVSYEGLEQLHRFIFIMAVTHVSYSCLTMLLAIVKIHRWRAWEDEAHMDRHDSLNDITREMTLRRQSTFVRYHTSHPITRNSFLIWVTCFFRQFGNSVVHADYLTLRKGFIMNHHLPLTYDFHSYMIRSMEEEFQRIVGVSAPLWGFVVAFMLFDVKGSNLYFWIASIPIALVLLVGTKLQHVIATLALESAGITGSFSGPKLKPRDDLFWFKKPELLLSLIHFILFQNAFELASFFWFWWQFGYNSCFIRNHMLVYARLILGFAGQFLCSYSTLPLYALVTQMGTNYKAALIPQRIRETIHGWGKAARRKRRLGMFTDDTTIHTETSTVMSIEDDDRRLIDDTYETTTDYTLQSREFGFGHRKGRVKWRNSALLELVPETKKENLEFELPMYDPSKGLVVDLAVVGGGPAGLAVAQQVSEAGLSVCAIDPSPKLIWPNNYGVWVDEFEAMDLLDCLDTTWSGAVVFTNEQSTKDLARPYGRVNRKQLKSKMLQKCISNGVKFHEAKVIKVIHEEFKSLLICNDGVTIQAAVVLDATGFSRCLVQYNKPYNPGYQVAYGILAEVEEHPFDVDKMVFMDWRDSHLDNNMILKERNSKIPTFLYAMPFSSNRIFLEETSLVARPGLQMSDIQERMELRLKHLGIKVKSIEEDEHCVIPMGGPLPVLPQRVVGIGGTAGMVHPSTGYMVARTLAAAPIVASAIVRLLGSDGRFRGDEISSEVWKDLWPIERRRQREFFCFGMDILLKLDLKGTRRFFDAFFDLEPRYWHGFLSSRLFLPELILFGLSLFSNASNASRLEIMAKGTPSLVKMIGNLVKDRE